jgi:hypothetical protein
VLVHDSKEKHQKAGRQDIRSHKDWVSEEFKRIQIVGFQDPESYYFSICFVRRREAVDRNFLQDDNYDDEIKHSTPNTKEVDVEILTLSKALMMHPSWIMFTGISDEHAAENIEPSVDSSIGV